MAGASAQSRRVKVLNANWTPATGSRGGQFELMVITEDDQIHTMSASPAEVSAVVALSQADTVLAFDPTNRTLIAANVVGTMPWTTRDAPPGSE
jgi:hypothetical protein